MKARTFSRLLIQKSKLYSTFPSQRKHQYLILTRSFSQSSTDNNSTEINKGFETTPFEPPSFQESNIEIPEFSYVDSVKLDSIDGIVETITQAPELTNSPSHLMMSLIDQIHTFMNIPYWGAIVFTTIVFRLATLPIAISATKNSVKMAMIQPELKRLTEQMNAEIDSEVKKKEYQNEVRNLFVKNKINPIRGLTLPIVQIPFAISLFFALKEMGIYFPGMNTGGALWFTDLTIADSTHILPIVNSISFLILFEITTSDTPPSKQKNMMVWGMRGLGVLMFPMLIYMPQGLFIFWGASNFCSLLQSVFLRNKQVKKYFDIPDLINQEIITSPVAYPSSSVTGISSNDLLKNQNLIKDLQIEFLKKKILEINKEIVKMKLSTSHQTEEHLEESIRIQQEQDAKKLKDLQQQISFIQGEIERLSKESNMS